MNVHSLNSEKQFSFPHSGFFLLMRSLNLFGIFVSQGNAVASINDGSQTLNLEVESNVFPADE
jgi:hypothetical protein